MPRTATEPPQPAPGGRVQAIGYVRVSTAEQADSGAGLAAQRAALIAAAQARGWDLRILSDEGVSAGDAATADKRPALAQALEQLAAGHAQALMVAKLDRLSRSVAHGAGLLELAQRQRWALVALDLAVDTSTPAGEMFGNLLLTMARFEKRLIGQRTRDALAVKKAAGVRLGRPPALPPELVARILAQRQAGHSYPHIANQLNHEQVPTAHRGTQWWPATIAAICRRLPLPQQQTLKAGDYCSNLSAVRGRRQPNA